MKGEKVVFTKEEAYKIIKIPVSHHFLYMECECTIDDEPSLVVKEHIVDSWRKPMYSKMQLSYLLKHPSRASFLSARYWSPCPYDDEIAKNVRERVLREKCYER